MVHRQKNRQLPFSVASEEKKSQIAPLATDSAVPGMLCIATINNFWRVYRNCFVCVSYLFRFCLARKPLKGEIHRLSSTLQAFFLYVLGFFFVLFLFGFFFWFLVLSAQLSDLQNGDFYSVRVMLTVSCNFNTQNELVSL